HNNLLCDARGDSNGGCSAAFSLYGDFAQIDNVLVQENLFNTYGSYCTYAGALPKNYPHATNVRYMGNHFGRIFEPNCGFYGPVTGWEWNAGNVWSGNVWDDSGVPVTP